MRFGQDICAALFCAIEAVRDTVSTQERILWQPQLECVITKDVCNHGIESGLFPPQYILPLRGCKPAGQIILTMTTQHTSAHRIEIVPLPAFKDNYIWLLRVGNTATVVDPGDSEVVEHYLAQHQLNLTAILITHHHPDHTGGVANLLLGHQPDVYAPVDNRIEAVTHPLHDGDEVVLADLDLCLRVIAVPGHTDTHIAYYAPGMLFPGDTLFSAGCGRLLGGTAAQLHDSLQRLATLPGDTAVYCTHEYTLSNLAFAQAVDPDNPARDEWLATCQALRAENRPTLPSTLEREKSINPFLRTTAPGVMAAVTHHTGTQPPDALACFTALRTWKDNY